MSGEPVFAGRPGARGFPLAIVLALGACAYLNSLQAPFLFDSERIFVDPSLEDIRLPMPSDRSLVKFTWQINFLLGGRNVLGYHAFNLAIHIGCAWVLYDLVRRTLRTSRIPAPLAAEADLVAGATTLLWVLHPLQTQAVTYMIQRAESMMALFYLLSLQVLVRGADSARPLRWWAWGALCGVLGAMCKPVICTLPVVALLYDRVFLSSSIGEALRRRAPLYLGYLATWAVLYWTFVLGPGTGTPENPAPVATPQAPVERTLPYLRTQLAVVAHYARLAILPHPLCLDYGWPLARSWGEVFPAGLVTLGLLAATLVFLWRRPGIGFLGAFFFLALAPTSSVLPLSDACVEHRMYLPLAPLCAAAGLAGRAFLARIPHRSRANLFTDVVWVTAVVLGLLTYLRNADYLRDERIWRKTVALRPLHARAWCNWGHALIGEERYWEAVPALEEALRLKPGFDAVHNFIGIALAETGRLQEAEAHLVTAVGLAPGVVSARLNYGNILALLGRKDEAIAQYEEALRIQPTYGQARVMRSLVEQGRWPEPGRRAQADAVTRMQRGCALALEGRYAEALPHLEEAVRALPGDPEPRINLGNVLDALGRPVEARAAYEEALRLRPEAPSIRLNLARVLRTLGNAAEAAGQFREAERLAVEQGDEVLLALIRRVASGDAPR